jgi:hypothetical protein
MDEILWPLAALLGWAALLYKLRDLLREPASRPLRLLCSILACLPLTAILGSRTAYVAFDRRVGTPNLGELVLNVSGMCFVIAAQRLTLRWAYPTEQARRRRNWWPSLYVLALCAQLVLFILAPVDEESTQFVVRYADTAYARESILIVDICLLVTLADIARLCWRYASVAGRRFLRIGLRCTAIGAISGIGYFSVEVVYVIARTVHVTLFPDDLMRSLYSSIGFAAAVSITIGLTIPAWGPRLAAATAWLRRYLVYRRLHPLWLALYHASPHIALDVPTRLKDPLWLSDLDYRLVRRVVEIRDGRLALRRYLDAGTAGHARHVGERAGLTGIALHAAVEAATIADAIRAKGEQLETSDPCDREAHGGSDLATESAWLRQVAHALTRLGSDHGGLGRRHANRTN